MEKVVKRKKEKGKKLCTYCLKSGHTENKWWVKNTTICSKEKDDVSKEKTEETELAAHVVNMGSTHLPLLCPFMAQQTSIPTQRDWIVDFGTSAHTCCK